MLYKDLSKKIKEITISELLDEYENGPQHFKALKLKLVHEEGGHSGDGEYVERVIEHKHDNGDKFYIKFTGFYSSYEGIEWDDEFKKVKPSKKTITVYQ